MKNILLSVVILCSSSMADALLLMKKGWQLVGAAQTITDMSQFRADEVEQVWHFDANTQKWQAYSPDPSLQQKMEEHNISKLTSLQNWHGFWIKSKKKWALKIHNTHPNTLPSDPDHAKDIIQLKAGWNLISLPVDSVISADIFQGMTVWKYDSHQNWELFDNQESDFPKLGHINNADGIWVKAPEDINISTMSEVAKLHNFATVEAMEDRIKEMAMLYSRPYCGIMPLTEDYLYEEGIAVDSAEPMALPTEGNSVRAENTTDTNLQEAAVDEADILKHNGVNIFYTSNNSHQVNITTFEALAQKRTEALNQILFDEDIQIDALYLVNNQLIVLSHQYTQGEKPLVAENEEEIYQPGKEYVLVDIFDVQDIHHIEKRSSHKIDGNMVDSRLIGEKLYLISSFTPQFKIEYPKIYTTLSSDCEAYFNGDADYYNNPYRYGACYGIEQEYETGRYFQYDYDNPSITVEDLLPEIEGSTLSKEALVTPNRLYSSSKEKQSTTITSISVIDIKEGTYLNSISYIGESYTQYASAKSLYLVSNDYPLYYDYYSYRDRSTIYKFNLTDQLSYQGIGTVYGNPINQFALSEQNNILRIATTDRFSWTSTGTHNTLYTLKEQNGLLPIQGVLDGLGETGESIRAVRFMGDKGYIVTARTSDPLYTLDLSDPLHPQKVGELHISGFSSYLHPIGEDKLLGIGQETDEYGQRKGLKIELFDVSDFAHPSTLDTINYAPSTYSELEENHKALAYRASDQLFAFPYRVYGDYNTDYRENNYLGIYQVRDNSLISYRAMRNNNDGWGEHRGLIFDLNNSTYVSFFSPQSVITQELNQSNIVN